MNVKSDYRFSHLEAKLGKGFRELACCSPSKKAEWGGKGANLVATWQQSLVKAGWGREGASWWPPRSKAWWYG